MNVIVVYLYNEMARPYVFDQDPNGNWQPINDMQRDSIKRRKPLIARGILAQSAGEDSMLDYATFDSNEQKNSLMVASVLISPFHATAAITLGGVSAYMSYQITKDSNDFTSFGVSILSHAGSYIIPQAQPLWLTIDNFNSIMTVAELLEEE